MNNLSDRQNLRYELLKANNYDVDNAKKCYDFVAGDEPQSQSIAGTTKLADGIYIMYGKHAVLFTGQEVSAQGCTGIGVNFSGKSLILATEDISDNGIELTTQQGGTRFITNYHQAAEDMDGKAATDDIRDILNMGISDDEYIPSLGELYFILAHFTQINAALKAVGGEPLHDDWYWSSTQYSATYAWGLGLDDGNAGFTTKAAFQYRVRPVSAFLPLNS
jgi:hypothetical protein